MFSNNLDKGCLSSIKKQLELIPHPPSHFQNVMTKLINIPYKTGQFARGYACLGFNSKVCHRRGSDVVHVQYAVWYSRHSLYSCSRFFLYLCLKALGWCQVCQVSISLHKTQIFEQIFLSIVPHRVSQVNRGTSHRDGHTVLQANSHTATQPRLVKIIDTLGFSVLSIWL